jgi:hypothetical protein
VYGWVLNAYREVDMKRKESTIERLMVGGFSRKQSETIEKAIRTNNLKKISERIGFELNWGTIVSPNGCMVSVSMFDH